MSASLHQFDVFLSYDRRDQDAVESLARLLQQYGLNAFVDRWYLTPGQPWPATLERVLTACSAALVVVGANAMGSWQQREKWLALERQARDPDFPVIPVLLPGAQPALEFLLFNTWIDLRQGVDDSDSLNRLCAAARRQQTLSQPARSEQCLMDEICPYKSLRYFQEQDAPFFFGRDDFTNLLVQSVARASLIAVVGASGCGKSSVVHAGLLPRLRKAHGNQLWEIATMVPGDQPLSRLAAALLAPLEPGMSEIDRLAEANKLARHLGEGTLALSDVVSRILEKQPGTDRFLLVVDQWEELYTLADNGSRERFVEQVLEASGKGLATVVLTVRGDFFDRVLANRKLADQLQQHVLNLGPMTRDELTEAIDKPARTLGLHFEAGLVDRLLDGVEDQPGALPLLEFALTLLWERRDEKSLTHAAYIELGTVSGAIGRRAEEIVSDLGSGNEDAVMGLYSRLVHITDSADATRTSRRRVPVSDLDSKASCLLKPFAKARLLVLDRDPNLGEKTVEIAHDALIHSWERLAKWVEQERSFLVWRQGLAVHYREWHRYGQSTNTLLTGPLLKEARLWQREHRHQLNSQENEFIEASVRTRQRKSGIRLAGLGLVVAIIAGLAAAIWFVRNSVQFNLATLVANDSVALSLASPPVIDHWLSSVSRAGFSDQIGSNRFGLIPDRLRVQALGTVALHLYARENAYADSPLILSEANEYAARAVAALRQLHGPEPRPDIPRFESIYDAYARLLHESGKTSEAQKVARELLDLLVDYDPPRRRVGSLLAVAPLLAKVEMSPEARAVLQSVESLLPGTKLMEQPSFRAFRHGQLALVYASLGDTELALQHADKLPLNQGGIPYVTRALAEFGEITQALGLARTKESFAALSDLAWRLSKQSHPDLAKDAVLDALSLATKDPMVNKVAVNIEVSHLLGMLLAEDGLNALAATVGARFGHFGLARLATVVASSGDLARSEVLAEEASKMVRSDVDELKRSESMILISAVLSHSGETAAALDIVERIQRPDLAVLGMAVVASTSAMSETLSLDQVQELVEKANEALPSIRDPFVRDAVLSELAAARAYLGEFATAIEVAEKIDSRNLDRRLVAHSDIISAYTKLNNPLDIEQETNEP